MAKTVKAKKLKVGDIVSYEGELVRVWSISKVYENREPQFTYDKRSKRDVVINPKSSKKIMLVFQAINESDDIVKPVMVDKNEFITVPDEAAVSILFEEKKPKTAYLGTNYDMTFTTTIEEDDLDRVTYSLKKRSGAV